MEYNVALVDDEAEVSEQLEKMIAEYGSRTGIEFVVSKFNNTSEFISAHPDNFVIVFMDINIPNDINGMKAIKKLRAMGSKAVVIFLYALCTVRYKRLRGRRAELSYKAFARGGVCPYDGSRYARAQAAEHK